MTASTCSCQKLAAAGWRVRCAACGQGAVTCRHCGDRLEVDDDVWIDSNGDDGCAGSDERHEAA